MIKEENHFFYFCGGYVKIKDTCRPVTHEKTTSVFRDNLKPHGQIRINKTHNSDESRQV